MSAIFSETLNFEWDKTIGGLKHRSSLKLGPKARPAASFSGICVNLSYVESVTIQQRKSECRNKPHPVEESVLEKNKKRSEPSP